MQDQMESTQVRPLSVKLKRQPDSVLDNLSDEKHDVLRDFLVNRLLAGNDTARGDRLERFRKIDQLISTWQKLGKEDAERERIEDVTGRNQAIPVNIPLLATHLEDMTSYFSEVFSPVGGNFFTSEASEAAVQVLRVMNRDAAARDQYSEITLTMRSLLKYNIGGFIVEWEPEGTPGSLTRESGNRWKSADMYNLLWDPAISNPKDLSTLGEWAAYVEVKNRLWLLKNSMAKRFSRVKEILDRDDLARRERNVGVASKKASFYRYPPASAGLPTDGSDTRSNGPDSNGQPTETMWNAYGLGLGQGGIQIPVDTYEQVTMYCWVTPSTFGLLTDNELRQLEDLGVDDSSFIELWKFIIIDGATIVLAEPVIPRDQAIQSAEATGASAIAGGTLPVHLSLMTQDQMQQAQRSYMELMRGFQRVGSYLVNIYIEGLRKNIWGLKGYDPQMFDVNQTQARDVAGWLRSKQPGRDVRTGVMQLDSNAGIDQAIDALGKMLDLSQRLFPTQQLPNQVASIDRAVTSQVTAVMQGAQRKLRMLARTIDSSLITPSRMTSYQNLVYFAKESVKVELTDEDMAKVVGSGIESIEAERIVGILEKMTFAIIQNQEAMQTYDVAGLMGYMSRLMHLGVDLGDFVKQPAQVQAQGGEQAIQPGHVAGAGAPQPGVTPSAV